MARLRRGIALFSIFLLLWTGLGAAETAEIAIQGGEGGIPESAELSMAAAAGNWLLAGDSWNALYYLYDLGTGAITQAPLVRMEAAEGGQTARYPIALAGEGERMFAVEVEIFQDAEGDLEYRGAALCEISLPAMESRELQKLDLSEAILHENGQDTILAHKGALMGGGFLFLLFEEPWRGGMFVDEAAATQKLLAFDLQTGEGRWESLTGAVCLVALREGALVYGRAMEGEANTLLVARAADGAERELFAVPGSERERTSVIAYDAAENAVLFCRGNRVWGMRSTDPSAAKIVASLPATSSHAAFFAGGRLAVAAGGRILLAQPDWDYRLETRRFVVNGGDASLEAFAAAHPELEIEEVYLSSDELVEAILTRRATPDVITIDTLDAPVFRSLMRRGMLMPMESEEIQRFAEGMHPDLRAEVSSQGQVCAIPVSIISQDQIGVNWELWQAMELGRLPETWEEFADFLNRWPAIAERYPEVALFEYCADREELRKSLLACIMRSFEVYRTRAEEPPLYDGEVFRGMIAAWQSIDFDSLELAEAQSGQGLFRNNVHTDRLLTDTRYRALPLHIGGEEPFLILSMHVAFINPYSENPEIGLELIESMLKDMSPLDRALLLPDANEPVRYESFEADMAFYQERIAALEESLSSLQSPEEIADAELELATMREYQAETMNSWWISAEGLAAYREASQHIAVLYASGLNAQDGNALSEKHAQFLNGEISLDDYIAEMDRRLTMAELEDR